MTDWAVEIAFDAGPKDALSAATWTDITDYVTELDIDRGRQQKLTRTQAGTLTVRLEDTDGRFNPANTASPYWPDVKPNRRIRVTADAGAYSDSYTDDYEGTEVLFSGFVDRWPQSWPEAEFVPVTIEATDGFKILAQKSLPTSIWAHEIDQVSPDHWWRLGESASTDAVDNGFAEQLGDGTYSGSPTLGTSGLVDHDDNTAVEFDGTDDRIDIPGTVGATGSLSIVFRVSSVQARSGSGSRVIWAQGDRSFPALGLHVTDSGVTDPDTIGFTLSTDGTSGESGVVTDGTTVADDSDHTVGLTYDASVPEVKVYIDGTERTNDWAGSATSLYEPDNIRVADLFSGQTHKSLGSDDPLPGVLDEIGYWDGTVLTSAQMSTIHDAATAPWNGDTSGERVGRVLDVAGWPAADRDVDTGQTTFGDGVFSDDSNVLEYLHRCAESENGLFFIDRTGKARFIERHAAIVETAYTDSQGTFTDAPGAGEFNYEALEPDYDDDLVNIATFQRKFGVTVQVTDETSRDAYGDSELTRTGLLMDSDSEAREAARWVVVHNAEPRVEVRRIVLRPEMDNAVWPLALGLDLGERVAVERTPKHGGDSFSQESGIQGIAQRLRPEVWETAWTLSPVNTQDYWILGDAELSVLGSTTRLAY